MFTSNFARCRILPGDLRAVSIAIGPPRWYRGRQELRLAPTRAMLHLPRLEYDEQFAEILARLDPQEIAASLGLNAVMLCWESPNVYCHRRLVAEWLEEHLRIEVPEYGFERNQILPVREMEFKQTTPRKRKSPQGLLFE